MNHADGVPWVACVSCDPAILARDVERFDEAGYGVVRACAVVMFPGVG